MSKLRCGFAQDIITPFEQGMYLDGYGFRLSPAEGIHDDLYVKVCAFECGGERFAIAAYDLCGFNAELHDILRYHVHNINRETLSPDAIALCSTHTHAGPTGGLIAHLPVNYDYWNRVGQITGFAVKRAFGQLTEGCLVSCCADGYFLHTYNRRHCPDIDRRVHAAAFFAEKTGELKGVIASASCHPVYWRYMTVSADYPSVLTREAAKKYPDVPVLFLQSRCGDVDPIMDLPTEDGVERLGMELTNGVFAVLEKLKEKRDFGKTDYHIAYSYRTISVPMAQYPPDDTQKELIALLSERYYSLPDGPEKHYVLRELSWRRDMLSRSLRNIKSEVRAPLQVLAIKNAAAFVFLPFEQFTRTGQTIETLLCRHDFVPENCYCIAHANSSVGYLPPMQEMEKDTYEISNAQQWYNTPLFSRDSESTVLSEISDILEKLDSKMNKL